jgi:hypothetical protein
MDSGEIASTMDMFHRDPLCTGHVASAIPSLSVAMIRRGLGEIRGRWAQSTPENPMFICDSLCPKLQTDMSVQKFASLFVLGQHLKRHAKSNVQRAATALLKTSAGAAAGAATGPAAGPATGPSTGPAAGPVAAQEPTFAPASEPTSAPVSATESVPASVAASVAASATASSPALCKPTPTQVIPAMAAMESGPPRPAGSSRSAGTPKSGGPTPKNGAHNRKPQTAGSPRNHQGAGAAQMASMSVSAEGVLTMRSSAEGTAPTTHYVLTRVNP